MNNRKYDNNKIILKEIIILKRILSLLNMNDLLKTFERI
jgi:hypothetical protein